MAEAASVPLVALTAWQALVERANVRPARRCSSTPAPAAWAPRHPAGQAPRRHRATTTGTSNVDWVAELGADTVIDYKTQQFDELLSGFDVVLDSQGGDTLARSLHVLRPGGLAIGIAGPPDPDFARRQGLALPLRLAIAAMRA